MPPLQIQQVLPLAMQHHQAGRLAEAEALYRQVLAEYPDNFDALHLLGLVANARGQREVAAELIGRAIALHSGGDDGRELKGAGDGRVSNADLARAHYNLGNALQGLGRLEAAIASFEKSIALQPNYVAAHYNMAVALMGAGRIDAGIAGYRKVIALKPDYPDAHNNLGNALAKKGELDEAVAAYHQAIALKPDYAKAHNNLGNALASMGQLEAAVAEFRKAIASDAAYAESYNGLGYALRDLGRFEEASESFRKALAINPEAHIYMGLASTGRRVVDAAELERITKLLEEPGLAAVERVNAEFAIGKLLDEAERFDEAFEHFARGNRLFKDTCAAEGERFEAADLHEQVDRAMENFNPAFFTERRGWGDPSELPVFIVGMPRSCTSLVEQIAASHPSVFGAGELTVMPQLSKALPGGLDTAESQASINSSPRAWDSESIRKASAAYLGYVRSIGGAAARVTDKLPANVFHLGLIAVMFPNARVIFCRRDARDNCLSCFFERFTRSNLLFSYDLADCGRQYHETERLVQHWLQNLPLRMMEMQYETLVAEQDRESRRLIDFLGLEWSASCAEFHRTKRSVQTASAWQVRQPMYSRSVGRWRHYERHLGPLMKALEER